MVQATGTLALTGPVIDSEVLEEKVKLMPVYQRRPILSTNNKHLILLVGLKGSPIDDFTVQSQLPPCSVIHVDHAGGHHEVIQRIRNGFENYNTVVLFGSNLGRKKYRRSILRAWKHSRNTIRIAAHVRESAEDWKARCESRYSEARPADLNRIWGSYVEPTIKEDFNIVVDSMFKLMALLYLIEI